MNLVNYYLDYRFSEVIIRNQMGTPFVRIYLMTLTVRYLRDDAWYCICQKETPRQQCCVNFNEESTKYIEANYYIIDCLHEFAQ